MDEKVGGEAQVCRLCGQFESIYIDVFGDEGTRRLLGLKIHSRINILIDETDPLPKTICVQCLGKLEFVCDFQEECLRTQRLLRDRYHLPPLPDLEKTKEMLQKFSGERSGWVLVGDKQWFFPARYVEQGKGFFEFKARSSDTWVVSYPRSGTTWTQELVWLLSNNLDFETASKKYLAERFPFLEFSLFNHPEVTEEFVQLNKADPEKQKLCRKLGMPGYEVLDAMDSPRFIKSHFPFSLLPGIVNVGCKIIYVARNPKDVAVSWYHLNRAIKTQGYTGTFEEFWHYFEDNLTPWSPYWEHLKEAWALRHQPNLLFMFYEEMQQDLNECVHKVSKFLGKNYSNDEISKLCNYLHINNFKNNPMVNSSELKDCKIISAGSFVRNGQSGTWSETFNEKLEAIADDWILRNLKGSDFVFPTFNNNY